MKTPTGNPTMKTTRISMLVTVAAALLEAFAAHAADTADPAARASRYESGSDVTPLREIDAMLQASIGDAARRAELEALLIRMLAAESTFEARRAACERLSVCGTEAALPALAPLLADEQTAGIACLALGGIASPKATGLKPQFTTDGAFGITRASRAKPPSSSVSLPIVNLGANDTTNAPDLRRPLMAAATSAMTGGCTARKTMS